MALNRNKFVKQTCSQAEYKDVLSNSGTDAAGSMQKRVCDKQTRRPRIDKDVNSWTAVGIAAVSFLALVYCNGSLRREEKRCGILQKR